MSNAHAAAITCDTEVCEVCQTATVEGNDELGRCTPCSHDSLDWSLRLMAAGVTRNPKSGQFTKV